ncbi:MAG: 50S ribosomal protein L5 [Parcubacteria group bacterium RIFCSPHIGHO2_01_FULL_45_26]|nr:ribosomal protein L5 [uncultured bacterium]OHB17550.1 MAG: 50S ribosomal protein L5 [Parcubacteria group bacterium RIFCSPHIGHO2_01_FULL_45_26]
MTQRIKEKFEKAIPSLMKKLSVKNMLAIPKIDKVIVTVGTGSYKDKKKIEIVADRLAKITGQKPTSTSAKKSIATFKLRAGDPSGLKVTLRGVRMYDFLDRLINVAIPRERDFRGLKTGAIDEMGNLSIGFKEHTIFPETADEDLKDVFSFGVTICTTAKNKKEALTLFTVLNFPFKKE